VKDLRKLLLICVHDNNWHFRKVIAKYMKNIICEKLSKDTFQTYFYNELIDLLNDED
jgi:hypothetical protein